MGLRVFKTKWFTRFARKERIADERLCEAIRRAEGGSIDAILGGDLIKQRLARPGAGRRGGYRTVIAYRTKTRAVFLYGFAKSERDNVEDDDLQDLQAAARQYFRLSEAEFDKAVAADKLTEVMCDDEEVPE